MNEIIYLHLINVKRNFSYFLNLSTSENEIDHPADHPAVQLAKKETEVNDKKNVDAQKNKLLDQVEMTKDQIEKLEV